MDVDGNTGGAGLLGTGDARNRCWASACLVALKLILAIFGALVAFTALNRAFDGIATLGWQGPTDFFTVADASTFAVQDNHTRFLGDVWLARYASRSSSRR